MCPMGRRPILSFLEDMERKKDRTWWKGERDVWFDPSANSKGVW
jgi:hypothetical protein